MMRCLIGALLLGWCSGLWAQPPPATPTPTPPPPPAAEPDSRPAFRPSEEVPADAEVDFPGDL